MTVSDLLEQLCNMQCNAMAACNGNIPKVKNNADIHCWILTLLGVLRSLIACKEYQLKVDSCTEIDVLVLNM